MQISITDFLRNHLTGDDRTYAATGEAIVIPLNEQGTAARTVQRIRSAFQHLDSALQGSRTRTTRPGRRVPPPARVTALRHPSTRRTGDGGHGSSGSGLLLAGLLLLGQTGGLVAGLGGLLRRGEAAAAGAIRSAHETGRTLLGSVVRRAGSLLGGVLRGVQSTWNALRGGVATLLATSASAAEGVVRAFEEPSVRPSSKEAPLLHDQLPPDTSESTTAGIKTFWERSLATIREWLNSLFGFWNQDALFGTGGSGSTPAGTTPSSGGGGATPHVESRGDGVTPRVGAVGGVTPVEGSPSAVQSADNAPRKIETASTALPRNGVSGVDNAWSPKTADSIRDAMIDRAVRVSGVTVNQAAGVIGGFSGESINDPTDHTGDSGQAYGSGQWHPDRQRPLFAYARITGKNPALRSTQQDFAFHEAGITRDPASLNMTPEQKQASGYHSREGLIGRRNRQIVENPNSSARDNARAQVHGYERSAASRQAQEAEEAGEVAEHAAQHYRSHERILSTPPAADAVVKTDDDKPATHPTEAPAMAVRDRDETPPPAETRRAPSSVQTEKETPPPEHHAEVISDDGHHHRHRRHPHRVLKVGAGMLIVGTDYA